MSLHYSGYGLEFQSDRRIPGLVRLESCARVDVNIVFGSLPATLEHSLKQGETLRYTSSFLDEHGQPALIVWQLRDGGFLRFCYTDGAEFILDQEGERVWIPPTDSSEEDIYSYLLGPILGFLLRLRGLTCLHASAVLVEEKAIVFAGSNLAGKSTTAMAFAGLGFEVLADDNVPLSVEEGVVMATPSYPCLRMRPGALAVIDSAGIQTTPALPPVDPERRLHVDLEAFGLGFESEPRPVGSLYLLTGPDPSLSIPRSERMRQSEGFLELVPNTYATRFLSREMRAEEFVLLSEVVARVPVRRLSIPADPAKLHLLPELIEADLAREDEVPWPSGTLSRASA